MSTPTSATSTRATVSLTPGIVVSRSAASRKGRSTSGLLLQFLHGGAQRIDLPQVQLQQETVVRRHPAVHRGDVRTVGLQAPVGTNQPTARDRSPRR